MSIASSRPDWRTIRCTCSMGRPRSTARSAISIGSLRFIRIARRTLLGDAPIIAQQARRERPMRVASTFI